jgi:hypothetical protein
MGWKYNMSPRVEAMLLGISLKSLERKLEEAEEGGNIEPKEAREIRRGLARGKRRVAQLEKEAEDQEEDKLERSVQRLARFLVNNGSDLSDEEYEGLVRNHDNAQALLESLRNEREQKRQRKVPPGPRRGADYVNAVRRAMAGSKGQTRKSASRPGEGRGYWCPDCGQWHEV